MSDKTYISDTEAALKLGVSAFTVGKWVRKGLLKGEVRLTYKPVETVYVDPASMNISYNGKCAYCKKDFELSRRGRRGIYCGDRCRALSNYHKNKKLVKRPGSRKKT